MDNEMNQVNSNSEYSTQPIQQASDEKLGLGEVVVAAALVGAGAGIMAGVSKIKQLLEEKAAEKAAKKKKKKKKKKKDEKPDSSEKESDEDSSDEEEED